MTRPFSAAVIAGAANSRQGKKLEDATSVSIGIEAVVHLLDEVGMSRSEIDGVAGDTSDEIIYALGLGPVWSSRNGLGVRTVVESALAIEAGLCSAVLVVAGRAGTYSDRSATAPWTRGGTELSTLVGSYNTVECALQAQRHMHLFGTTSVQLARAAALARNNGHVNPEAVFYGRGPYTVDDVLASRMIADPLRLLDCCITSEGACAMLLTRRDRARDLRLPAVAILGAGVDVVGRPNHHPPTWDRRPTFGRDIDGYVGRRAAKLAFEMAGLGPDDVDVLELYDPFSFELIRQVEAFGFCGEGEGGDYIAEGHLDVGGRHPASTDGGLLSFSHAGGSVQGTQRIVRAVHQLQGRCRTLQVEDAEVALASYGGGSTFFTDVVLLGRERS